MKKLTSTWIIFLAALAVVIGALVWVSSRVIASAREEQREERVRLALWRMDSTLASLVLAESARPYFEYDTFFSAAHPFLTGTGRVPQGDQLTPSPLLTLDQPVIALHLQVRGADDLTSPQVPTGVARDRALKSGLNSYLLSDRERRLEEVREVLRGEDFAARLATASENAIATLSKGKSPELSEQAGDDVAELSVQQQQVASISPLQNGKNTDEFVQRFNLRNSIVDSNQRALPRQTIGCDLIAKETIDVNVGGMQPLWLNDHLFLARRVAVYERSFVQACWFDWEKLERSLLDQVSDLLPNARLTPAVMRSSSGDVDAARRLAVVPAAVVANTVDVPLAECLTTVGGPLALAWGCVLVFAVAVALLLRSAVSLSERRGAFVSAVTHELRTPLTTFRMYSEMLAEDMVADDSARQRYLQTLNREAGRLGHMVENVLAYARLENRDVTSDAEVISVECVLERAGARLRDRAQQGGFELTIDASGVGTPAEARLRVNVSVVEQILLNLIDNACKYARPRARDEAQRIQLAVSATTAHVSFRVRDFGPGVAADVAKRLFQPFSKSARQAAVSAPGIGLGLALSRRLARSMGGDLDTVDVGSGESGACFELRVPRLPAADGSR